MTNGPVGLERRRGRHGPAVVLALIANGKIRAASGPVKSPILYMRLCRACYQQQQDKAEPARSLSAQVLSHRVFPGVVVWRCYSDTNTSAKERGADNFSRIYAIRLGQI